MAKLNDIIRNETRLCVADGTFGYFHCWEQWMSPFSLGLTDDSSQLRQVAHINGIVEFEDEVRRVNCESIKFIDEENQILQELSDPYET